MGGFLCGQSIVLKHNTEITNNKEVRLINWNILKCKTSASRRTLRRKWIGKSQRKHMQNIYLTIDFYAKYIKDTYNSVKKKISNPIKNEQRGLPWWRSGWESACQCRGHGFEPWSGRIPHAAEQLSPWATITEPARLEPVLRNKRGRDGERPAHRNEEWPPLATTGESPHTETKTQHSHK